MNLIFLMIPKIAWALSQKNILKALLIFVELEVFILQRYVLKVTSDYAVHVPCNGNNFTLYLHTKNDISALYEVFVKKVYAWDYPIPKYILDLGANFGETLLYFRMMYPNAHIIAVEPAPDSFQRLKKSFSNDTHCTLLQAAVTATGKEISFYINEENPMSNSMHRRSGNDKTVIVSGVTLGSIVNSLGGSKIDILKFDIEGGESELFSDLRPDEVADMIIGEFHRDLTNLDLESFLKLFENFEVHIEGNQTSEKCIIKARSKILNS